MSTLEGELKILRKKDGTDVQTTIDHNKTSTEEIPLQLVTLNTSQVAIHKNDETGIFDLHSKILLPHLNEKMSVISVKYGDIYRQMSVDGDVHLIKSKRNKPSVCASIWEKIEKLKISQSPHT